MFKGSRLRFGLVAALLVVAVASPAFAANFGWSADYVVKVRSRDYTSAAAGNHSIAAQTTAVNCPGPNNQFFIRLWRNRTLMPDIDHGEKAYNCGAQQVKNWNTTLAATYHFDVRKPNDGFQWRTEGVTTYP